MTSRINSTSIVSAGVVICSVIGLGFGCQTSTVMPGGSNANDNAADTGDQADTNTNDNVAGDQAVSFSRDIQPIFDFFCINCHVQDGIADRAGVALRLIDGASYDGLINRPSAFDANLTLVVPGDSSRSFLFEKVSSVMPSRGDRMPFSASPLNDASIELIRAWIDDGAENN